MEKFIIAEEHKLRAIIQEEVAKAFPIASKAKVEIDTMTLSDALSLLKEHGYPISKAKMYKLTATGDIPCKKFGQKLVFSCKDLLHWAENQTKAKNDKSEITLNLARSAKRKRRF